MTVEEIFRDTNEHMLHGIMLHEQLANYYDFLALKGYKRCHEYHYFCESAMHRKLWRFYINHFNKLIAVSNTDFIPVIPSNWYRYTRGEIDAGTKRKAVENALREWAKWENQTKDFYTDKIRELDALGEYFASGFFRELLADVEKEIKTATRKQIILNNVDYAINFIVGEQESVHEKYKEKLESMRIKM